jgi:hypothetical protein
VNDETNYGLEEAGMAQLDDSVGALMKALDDMGVANNTIVIFTTDNGAEVFTWPDGEFYDQPTGWTGPKVTLDWPKLYNIRQDPFERVPIQNIAGGAPAQFNEFYGREIWRFVGVQEFVTKLGDIAVDFPPMQAPTSFNLSEVKRKIQETIKAHQGD